MLRKQLGSFAGAAIKKQSCASNQDRSQHRMLRKPAPLAAHQNNTRHKLCATCNVQRSTYQWGSTNMAVPKKKVSYTRKRIKFNQKCKKQIPIVQYSVCSKCLSIKKKHYTCTQVPEGCFIQ
jgi:ribosomal protein L32